MNSNSWFWAARFSNYAELKDHLDNGFDINSTGFLKCTALHYSIIVSSYDCAELLLQHGADTELRDSYGQTPLHRAAAKGDIKMVRLLIYHDADIFSESSKGMTPLKCAVRNGHKICHDFLTLMQYIKKNHINPVRKHLQNTHPDPYTLYCARDLATKCGHNKIVRLLNEAGDHVSHKELADYLEIEETYVTQGIKIFSQLMSHKKI